MNSKAFVLDVRDDIRRGREPFSKIMQAVASLAPGQDLVLIAPFEPAPLYRVLEQQGLQHITEATPEGDFRVTFSRDIGKLVSHGKPPGSAKRASPKPSRSTCDGISVLDVDARGLEPPEPMVKILEAVATLPEGAQLRAHTDRRPMHLYAQLEQRGFIGDSQEQSDGSFLTVIRRAGSQ
jgi:uncharacterized protein (DUF2249 family)